jgi:hypothetical protein
VLAISDYRVLWACQCCVSTLAGSDTRAYETGLNAGTPEALLGSVSGRLGMPFVEHYCDGPAIDLSCVCDFKDFSYATCDGCGCQVAGVRYAVTLTD